MRISVSFIYFVHATLKSLFHRQSRARAQPRDKENTPDFDLPLMRYVEDIACRHVGAIARRADGCPLSPAAARFMIAVKAAPIAAIRLSTFTAHSPPSTQYLRA